jgi:hypothetical protein
MILGLNSLINMDSYNALVMKGGGHPIITKKQLISMKTFIGILLKLFRKDYISKYKKGGYNNSNNLGIYNIATKYGDLDYFGSYQPELKASLERTFI